MWSNNTIPRSTCSSHYDYIHKSFAVTQGAFHRRFRMMVEHEQIERLYTLKGMLPINFGVIQKR